MSGLQAVLFDMDGTLVETESLWYECEIRTMAQFGYAWTEQDRLKTLGSSQGQVVDYMSRLAAAGPHEINVALVTGIEDLVAARPLVVQPGARSLHSSLVEAGVPLGLASNSWRTLVDYVLSAIGFAFDASVAGDETEANKPDPCPYLRLAQMLGVDPSDCVVIEDSLPGVASGTAAGAAVVAVPEVSAKVVPGPRLIAVESLEDVSIEGLRKLIRSRSLATD